MSRKPVHLLLPLSLLLLILLVALAHRPSPLMAATLGSTATLTATPTATPTAIPSATGTATAVPTQSPTVTATSTQVVLPPTLTATPTGIAPTPTPPWASATPSATATAPPASATPLPTPTRVPPNTRLLRLPLMILESSPRQSVFGIEVHPYHARAVADEIEAAKLSWTRMNAIDWAQVEPVEGARQWGALASLESSLAELGRRGATPILLVKHAPSWAQRVPGSACGPIREDKLQAFASFMEDLARRYARPPYNVEYWELWNEPDVAVGLVPGNSVFGCWGDPNDYFFGGGYFGQMISVVAPAIRRGNPSAKVVLGGLLLDCDPENPPPGRDCREARFLEGVLIGGAGPHLDMIGYHAYSYWNGAREDWDLNNPAWRHRGGATFGKLHFIRSVLARYGVAGMPVILNETAFACHPSTHCPEDSLQHHQAIFAVRLYTRIWANQVGGAVWYTLNGPGWRQSGLLDGADGARPAYTSLHFMSNLLSGATYTGEVQDGQLEGHRFRKGASTIHVLWSNNGDDGQNYSLGAGRNELYNMYGQPLGHNGTEIGVGFEPFFLVTTP